MGQWASALHRSPLRLRRSDPPSGFTGANVLRLQSRGSCYLNNMATTEYLTTTAINCTGLSQTRLRFERWLGVERVAYDHATIDVSSNGTTWTNVWSQSRSHAQHYRISVVAPDLRH